MPARVAPLDPVALDRVLRDTITAIERGHQQVFFIAEQARDEYEEVARELEEVREEVRRLVDEVDQLARLEQRARLRLVEISRHFPLHGEEAYREAYEEAMRVHEQLARMRERESQLRQRRDVLERRLRRLGETMSRAEELAAQIRLALELLSGKLSDLVRRARDLSHRYHVGLMMLQAQEEERRRLARDIHDGPAQMLANVVLRLEVCQRLLAEDPDRARTELERLKQMVRDSLQDVRKIIFDLRPMALDDLGLVPALRQYVAGFEEKTGLPTRLVTRGPVRRLDPAVEITVYRVVQEALNNVWKHASATEAVVRLEFARDRLWAEVIDDGVGFDPAEGAGRVDRFGLTNMRERVGMVDGRLDVVSERGKGTRVRIEVPVGRELARDADQGLDR
ncbi:MAG: histidine kinase [Bacillota bacterium]